MERYSVFSRNRGKYGPQKRLYLNTFHAVMLYFNFLEKCLGLISPPHFVDDFSRIMFLMLYYMN